MARASTRKKSTASSGDAAGGKAKKSSAGSGGIKAKAKIKKGSAAKKSKTASSKSSIVKPKAKSKPKPPTVLVGPSSGSKITVVTLTLSDIKIILSSKSSGGTQGDADVSSDKTKVLSQKQQRCLVRVPSGAVRSQLYEEAARSIAEREGRALPGHGGRPWRCEVRVSDSAPSGSGKHGNVAAKNGASGFSGRAYGDGTKSSKNGGDKGDTKGAVTKGGAGGKGGGSGALFRWYRGSLELACLPHILEKIPEPLEGAAEAVLSPEHRPEYESDSDNDEWESEEDESDDEFGLKKTDLSNRECSELSELAWSHPSCNVPHVERKWLSPDMRYFYSRSSAISHARELIRRDKLIDRVLHGLGERGMRLRPAKPTRKMALEAGYVRFLRDGLWVVGQEEDWLRERGEWWGRREERRRKREERRKEDLVEKEKVGGMAFEMFRRCKKEEEAEELATLAEEEEAREREEEEKAAAAAEVAASDEEKKEDAPVVPEKKKRKKVNNKKKKLTDAALMLQWDALSEEEKGRWEELARVEAQILSPRKSSSEMTEGGDAEKVDGSKSAAEIDSPMERAREALAEAARVKKAASVALVSPSPNASAPSPVTEEMKVKKGGGNDDLTDAAGLGSKQSSDATMAKSPLKDAASEVKNGDGDGDPGDAAKPESKDSSDGDASGAPKDGANEKALETPQKANPAAVATAKTDAKEDDDDPFSSEDERPISSLTPKPRKITVPFDEEDHKPISSLISKKPIKIAPSHHYRLTPAQISLCLDAVLSHYDDVMRTVRARNLHFELADGFDVLRERGHGRYDMELDDFATPKFDFLTDLSKAAWMPVVKKILGDDAILVHKGAFLSLPGSDIQVYHQDGVHLTTKRQLPCHAINVFIPLVDLTKHNGPTEFCLGTHHLSYENYDKQMIETPTCPAGTPVIFDYRLGHRGMGNCDSEPRPVVYLTYTSAKNEFRDSVNFSRKRYKKLGALVERPLSREERAAKRRK